MKMLGRSVDLFGDQIGDSRDLISGQVITGASANQTLTYANNTKGFDLRTPQTVAYSSPTVGGFSAMGAYGMDGGVNNVAIHSGLIKYSMGPAMIGLAYENHGKGLYYNPSTNPQATNSETAIRLAGSYRVSGFKFVGLYEHLNHLGALQNVAYDNGNLAKATVNVYGLGVAYTMGSNVFKTQVYQSNPEGTHNNSTLWAIGAEHHFSQRVMAFVDYAAVKNQSEIANAPWFGGKEYGSL
ncbi:hypothetical protein BI364_07545 [Acidihalobacter yilgarnensis]|uniref:Porin domain-containing protein n=2 Tax=Acidihalobacter yilgarnensis TaxID=2819280 RepID=A0A1D8IMY3_9GAMM|nr:hypothetical protein BI364_07545 [Acidihalobacter yilgarnensis]